MIHQSHSDALKKTGIVIGLMAVVLGLIWALPAPPAFKGIAGYVPLHILLETGAIVVAMLVFAIGWNAYSRERPGNIALLASLFLGVALLDFSHMLSFKGMPDFVTPSDPEKAINFWLAARILAATALLLVSATVWRPFANPRTRFYLLGLILALVLAANAWFLFQAASVPRTFIAGLGLTPFKIYAEWTIIAANLTALGLLWWRMRAPLPFNAPALFGAVCAMALSELCFTLYSNVTDIFNLLGHVYKVISYGFLYRAIFVETVEAPFRQLSDTQLQLHATLEAIPDLLWLKDVNGVYLNCNPAFQRFFGAEKEKIVGRTDYDFVPKETADGFREHDCKAMMAGRPSANEEWITFADDGIRCLVETIKTPIRDTAGKLIGVLGIARDITDRKRIERELQEMNSTLETMVKHRTESLENTNAQLSEALRKFQLAQNELVQAEKMAALGGMVAGFAHELNTPIGNSLMTASALQEQTAEFVVSYSTNGLRKATFEQYLNNAKTASDLIMHSLHRAAELISGFKQVAVDQQSSLQRVFCLRDQLAEIVLAMGPRLRKANVDVALDIAPDIEMNSYPGALGQVVMNLINNALIHAYGDATSGGGIAISAKQLEAGWVKLELEDAGQGIAPEHLRRIFDPFFTTRFGKGGSGLGLSIAHNLVTQVLEGKITVDSELGKYTRFTIILPLVTATKAEG